MRRTRSSNVPIQSNCSRIQLALKYFALSPLLLTTTVAERVPNFDEKNLFLTRMINGSQLASPTSTSTITSVDRNNKRVGRQFPEDLEIWQLDPFQLQTKGQPNNNKGENHSPFVERSLQTDEDDTNSSFSFPSSSCSLCFMGNLQEDFQPPYEPNEEVNIPAGMTCGDFSSLGPFLEDNSLDCKSLQQLFPFCCETTIAPYECESATRQQVLKNMDTVVPPIPKYGQSLNVTVLLTYQAVTDLDVQDGSVDIFIWIDLFWNDPRLAWNLTLDSDQLENGDVGGLGTCANEISVRASMNREQTEIWVPDFDVYNRITSMQSFEESFAEVFPNGNIHWRRSGIIRSVCQFDGLAKIPFDELGCQIFMGGQLRIARDFRTNSHVNYVLEETTGGLTLGEWTPTYNEYQIIEDRLDAGHNPNWPGSLYFTFYFSRAKNYYVFNIVIPTIILTYVSFGTFLLDLRLGERLSYGMALALVIVAQQIVTSDLLPVSNERLWIDKFVGWSFYWVVFGLLESVFVSLIFFKREERHEQLREEEREKQKKLDEANRLRSILKVLENEESGDNQIHRSKKKSASIGEQDRVFKQMTQAGQINQQSGIEGLDIIVDSDEDNQKSQEGGINETRSYPKSYSMKDALQMKYKTKREKILYSYPLLKIDKFFFYLCVFTYTGFLIGMFSSTHLWGKNVDPYYVQETDEAQAWFNNN